MEWIQAPACQSRVHCRACLSDPAWHARRSTRYVMPPQGTCPHGVTLETVDHSKMRGLGDLVAKATKAVGIKPCGGCRKRQEKLNKLVPFNKAKP